MSGAETAEDGEERFQFTTAAVDDIAGEEDQLWFKGIDTLHHAAYDSGTQGETAQMKVAELHDTEAFKPLGETRRDILHPLHLQAGRLHHRGVEHEESNHCSGHHGEDAAPRIRAC